MNDNFDTKLRFLARQIAWLVIGFFIFFAAGWGIYVGCTYSSDECVRQTPYSLALDVWLIAACVYDVVFWFATMVLLCCRARSACRRCVTWPLNVLNVSWMLIGVWLLIESQIRCQHNLVWVMSLVVICITLTIATTLMLVMCCTRLGACSRLGRWMSFEDSPYDFYMRIPVADVVADDAD